jgi:hypothetical protein
MATFILPVTMVNKFVKSRILSHSKKILVLNYEKLYFFSIVYIPSIIGAIIFTGYENTASHDLQYSPWARYGWKSRYKKN